ncbi:MAG: hypothetical protein JNM69_12985 [Archangium sp.]|nr:hypothetical protein [Archangium sp.]
MFRLVTLISLVITSTAAAATDARWGLTWKAPEGCIGPGDLAQAVEEKLGRSIFAKDPQFRVEGRLQEGTSPRWKARLTLVSAAGEVLGTRELTADDADCRALDKKLALVMALTIEPQLERKAPLVMTGEAGPPPMPKDAALVHIDSDSRDVRLLRYAGTSYGSAYTGRGTATVAITSFADECRAPCDTVINRSDDRFFIGGSGVTMTNELILADHANKAGQVNLQVKAGNAGGHFLGLMSFITGLTAIGLGATFALVGGGSSSSFGGGFVAGGIVTALVGGVLTAVGIPVWLNNRTEVSFADGTVVH